MDVDGGNTNSHTLTGLINGETYTICIVGTSSSSAVVPSAPVSAGAVGLGRSNNLYTGLVVFFSNVYSFYESNSSFIHTAFIHVQIVESTVNSSLF